MVTDDTYQEIEGVQELLAINDFTLWRNLRQAERDFFPVRWQFLSGCTDRILVIGQALNKASDRGTVLRLLLYLDVKERLPFFDDLVSLASVDHSDVELVWDVILSLPKDFLLIDRRI